MKECLLYMCEIVFGIVTGMVDVIHIIYNCKRKTEIGLRCIYYM